MSQGPGWHLKALPTIAGLEVCLCSLKRSLSHKSSAEVTTAAYLIRSHLIQAQSSPFISHAQFLDVCGHDDCTALEDSALPFCQALFKLSNPLNWYPSPFPNSACTWRLGSMFNATTISQFWHLSHFHLGMGHLTFLDWCWRCPQSCLQPNHRLRYLMSSYFSFQISHDLFDEQIRATWTYQWSDVANEMAMLIRYINSHGFSLGDILYIMQHEL